MNSPQFKAAIFASLDVDLRDLVAKNLATGAEAILAQELRILRGRPFNVDLQPQVEGGWSADGKTWLPKAPGT